MMGSELFNTLDLVLREILNTDVPMAGKLVIATGDCQQLPPIDQRPIWLSTHMLTTFHLLELTNYVRAAQDPDLRRVIEVLRSPVDNQATDQVCAILQARCHFVQCWSQVPRQAMRVVSTRKAEKHVTDLFIQDLQQDNVEVVTIKAKDEVENAGATWAPASSYISRQLDRKVLEGHSLHLFRGAVVRMTFNNNTTRQVFSQGQMAVVLDLPDMEQEDAMSKLQLKLVPPGEHDVSRYQEQDDWPVIYVVRRLTPDTVVGSNMQKARRYQFPVSLHLACTVHRIIGQTCAKVGTQIDAKDPHFRLWQREQLLVLLSRTRSLDDFYFVGNQASAMTMIREVMSKPNRLADYTAQLVTKLATGNIDRGIYVPEPFLPYYAEIPQSRCGYVYALISSDLRHSLVGHTNDIVHRLREINQGGSVRLNHGHRQWSLLALVTGFESEEFDMTVERSNFGSGLESRAGPLPTTPQHALQNIQDLLHDFNRARDRLQKTTHLILTCYQQIPPPPPE